MKGAKPKTEQERERDGSYARYPGRFRKSEEVPEPLGDPYPWMDDVQSGWWYELASSTPARLTASDRMMVMEAAVLCAEAETSRGKMATTRWRALHAVLSELGMSPTARRRFLRGGAGKDEDEDPFGDDALEA